VKKFVFVFLCLLSCTNKNFFSFSPETAEGTLFSFEPLKETTASVFVFLSPDCPLSENYTLPIRQLNEKFSKHGIKLFAVFPGRHCDKDEIKKFAEEFQLQIPLLADRDRELLNFFDASITPEAFVVNQKGEIVYSGSIDNGYASLGKKREVITEYYLEDALNALLSGTEIKIKKTEAVGCFIE